jgi:hypothetical protein
MTGAGGDMDGGAGTNGRGHGHGEAWERVSGSQRAGLPAVAQWRRHTSDGARAG